jgi:hypothetical protein
LYIYPSSSGSECRSQRSEDCEYSQKLQLWFKSGALRRGVKDGELKSLKWCGNWEMAKLVDKFGVETRWYIGYGLKGSGNTYNSSICIKKLEYHDVQK